MRLLASLLNIALMLFLVYSLLENGAPSADEMGVVSLAFGAPTASLIALYLRPEGNDPSLFSLYFERKRLEEMQRIEKLRSGIKR